MNKLILPLIVLMLALAIPCLAATSYLGPTGNILTPDATVVEQGTWEAGYHQFIEVFADVDLISTSV